MRGADALQNLSLERDAIKLNRITISSISWSVISAQTRERLSRPRKRFAFVALLNRFPLLRITLCRAI